MNATEIAQRLGKARRTADIYPLIRACDSRRVAIRERILEISDPRPPIAKPSERLAAILKGPAAVQALDDAIKELEREHRYLDALELQANTACERAETERARQAIPGARTQLSSRLAAARSKLKALDEALAELRVTVETLGDFGLVPGMAFPLTDAQLAELLAFRDELWQPRTAATLTPAGDPEELREAYPQSFALMYRERALGSFETRRPPSFMSALDFTVESARRFGRIG